MRGIEIEQDIPCGIAEQLRRRAERPGAKCAGAGDMGCLVGESGGSAEQPGEMLDLARQPLDNRRQLSIMPRRTRARWRQVATPTIVTIG